MCVFGKGALMSEADQIARDICHSSFHLSNPIPVGRGTRNACDFFSAHSFHTGGINVTLGNGSTSFINDTIDLQVWRSLSKTNSGETVSGL